MTLKVDKHFYEFGPFRLDPQRRRLFRDGEYVPFLPKATETLIVFVKRRQALGTRGIDQGGLGRDVCGGCQSFGSHLAVVKSALNIEFSFRLPCESAKIAISTASCGHPVVEMHGH